MPGTGIEPVQSRAPRDFKSLPLVKSYFSNILKIVTIFYDLEGLGCCQLQIQSDLITSFLKATVTNQLQNERVG